MTALQSTPLPRAPPASGLARNRRALCTQRRRSRAGSLYCAAAGEPLSRRAVDAVGAWLVAHPAPLWLVNNPLKRWLTTQAAGPYDAVAAAAELRRLIDSDDVVVFSATYCPFSARAKAELAAQLCPFTAVEWNTRADGGALVAELGVLTGRTSVPSIFIAGRSVGGCNDGTPGLRPLIASGELEAWLQACSPAFQARRAAALEARRAA